MNNHDDIRKLLAAYCGDDIEAAERRRIDEHLAGCAACRAELGDLQTTLRLIRTTPEVEPPPWLATRIMARIREQQLEKRSWRHRLFFPLHLKLPFEVAALLLVCVSGYYMARTVETELQQPASREEQVVAPPQADQFNDARKEAVPRAATPSAPASTSPPTANVQRTAKPEPPPPAQPLAPKAAEQAAPLQPPVYPGIPAPPHQFAAPPQVMKEERAAPAGEPMLGNTPAHQALPSEAPAKHARKAKKAAAELYKSFEATTDGSASLETARGAAVARPELNVPVVKIRIILTTPADASTRLKEMIVRTGGSLVDDHAVRPNTLTARLPSPRLRELLDQLERLGRIIDRPQPLDTAGIMEIKISW